MYFWVRVTRGVSELFGKWFRGDMGYGIWDFLGEKGNRAGLDGEVRVKSAEAAIAGLSSCDLLASASPGSSRGGTRDGGPVSFQRLNEEVGQEVSRSGGWCGGTRNLWSVGIALRQLPPGFHCIFRVPTLPPYFPRLTSPRFPAPR